MLATLYDSISKSHFPADFAAQKESAVTRIRSARGPREGELGGLIQATGLNNT